MPFEFINNADIDRRARKLIRSHAAKGKNIGKTLNRRKRSEAKPSAVELPSSQVVNDSKAVAYSRYIESYGAVLTIERQIGDALTVLPIPPELIRTSRNLIQQGMCALNCITASKMNADSEKPFTSSTGPYTLRSFVMWSISPTMAPCG